MSTGWLTPVADGVELSVQVVPRASRTRVVGEHGGRLKVQLAAPPVDGAANLALVEFVAALLGVKKAQVSLVAGAASKQKRVRVTGVDADAARAVISGR